MLKHRLKFSRKDVPDLLRVLSPSEQLCLTLDAQALIYEYRSKKWLDPQQLELLITEVVSISRIRGQLADVGMVTAVLRNMGSVDDVCLNLDMLSASDGGAKRLS